MVFERETEEEEKEEVETEEEETEEEVNPDAYMPTLQSEQAGVVHLIHGRCQLANEPRVFIIHSIQTNGY